MHDVRERLILEDDKSPVISGLVVAGSPLNIRPSALTKFRVRYPGATHTLGEVFGEGGDNARFITHDDGLIAEVALPQNAWGHIALRRVQAGDLTGWTTSAEECWCGLADGPCGCYHFADVLLTGRAEPENDISLEWRPVEEIAGWPSLCTRFEKGQKNDG